MLWTVCALGLMWKLLWELVVMLLAFLSHSKCKGQIPSLAAHNLSVWSLHFSRATMYLLLPSKLNSV